MSRSIRGVTTRRRFVHFRMLPYLLQVPCFCYGAFKAHPQLLFSDRYEGVIDQRCLPKSCRMTPHHMVLVTPICRWAPFHKKKERFCTSSIRGHWLDPRHRRCLISCDVGIINTTSSTGCTSVRYHFCTFCFSALSFFFFFFSLLRFPQAALDDIADQTWVGHGVCAPWVHSLP